MSSLYVFIATKTTNDVALPTQARTQVDFNRRIANAFRARAGGRLTVGDLKLRPNGEAIPNHLLCNGAAISRTQFPELFRLLGTAEGAGDGTTTFNLPNYLGQALAVPTASPTQRITERGTVEDGTPVTDEAGQVGGTEGGNIISGGVALQIARQ